MDEFVPDFEMEDLEEFERLSNQSMSSFGRSSSRAPKDPELSVNFRLLPKNLVDRPAGMPPLISDETRRQMDELEELKSTNRLHELASRNESRSTARLSSVVGSCRGSVNTSLNNSGGMMNFGISDPLHISFDDDEPAPSIPQRPKKKNNVLNCFKSFIEDAKKMEEDNVSIKSQSVPHSAAQSASRSTSQLAPRQASHFSTQQASQVVKMEPIDTKPFIMKTEFRADLIDKAIIEAINTNFGQKLDILLQKEIDKLQNKTFLYTCSETFIKQTFDGEGIDSPKYIYARGTGITLNLRFSKL